VQYVHNMKFAHMCLNSYFGKQFTECMGQSRHEYKSLVTKFTLKRTLRKRKYRWNDIFKTDYISMARECRRIKLTSE
jgi:hypothetical protein